MDQATASAQATLRDCAAAGKICTPPDKAVAQCEEYKKKCRGTIATWEAPSDQGGCDKCYAGAWEGGAAGALAATHPGGR